MIETLISYLQLPIYIYIYIYIYVQKNAPEFRNFNNKK